MSVLFVLVAILGLALLMIIHEGGHYLAARYFGMRVQRFSIGFGPALYKKQPKGSSTVFQIAIIPFLAYVQIDGMNPFEEIDPNDKASYANAPLHARVITIFAGPFANYVAASLLFFVALMVGGVAELSTEVRVMPGSAAEAAQMQTGDTIVSVNGVRIEQFEQVRDQVANRVGQTTPIEVRRGDKLVTLEVVPKKAEDGDRGVIGVMAGVTKVPVSIGKAAWLSIKQPPLIVYELVAGLGKIIMRKVSPQLSGPVGIVNEMTKAVKRGFADYVGLLGVLSAYLAGFNLLPFPALDGGRLMFLGYEAATRRRPNARVEAHIHAVGLILLLSLVAVVTVFSDVAQLGE